MKDILQDVVAHTHALGFLSLVKVSNEDGTTIDSMADDRSVILSAETHNPVNEFVGTFGMPNLDKLNLHLKKPRLRLHTETKTYREIPLNQGSDGKLWNQYRCQLDPALG